MKKRVVKLKAKQPVPLTARISTVDPVHGYVTLWCADGLMGLEWLKIAADVTLVPGHYSAIEKA